MTESRISRRGVLTAAAAVLLGGAARVPSGAAATGGTTWKQGDERTSIGGDSSGTLSVFAEGDLDITAGHVRMVTRDGNYEFEHSNEAPETHLNSYYSGTPTRTPISVGGDDGQDVLSFVVRGKRGQNHDLQQWAPGGDVALAVDGHGRLRLGEVVLVSEIVEGEARLVAILPDGKRQTLAG